MENKILDLFLFNNKLQFSQIEKKLNERSNKLAYHLKNLVKKGILEKEKDYYSLTEASEFLIPYLSKKRSILPVILIYIGNKKQAFLYTREKRPYQSYLSLPGGRLVIGETIEEATKRIMNEKFSIKASFQKINSVSLEKITKNKKVIHSFFLIFVTAKTNQKINFIDIHKSKLKIIKSDYKLIKNDLDKQLDIKIINSQIN